MGLRKKTFEMLMTYCCNKGRKVIQGEHCGECEIKGFCWPLCFSFQVEAGFQERYFNSLSSFSDNRESMLGLGYDDGNYRYSKQRNNNVFKRKLKEAIDGFGDMRMDTISLYASKSSGHSRMAQAVA